MCRHGDCYVAESHAPVNPVSVHPLHRGMARPGKCRVCGVANECPSRIQFSCVWVWFRRVFYRLLPLRSPKQSDLASSGCAALDRTDHDYLGCYLRGNDVCPEHAGFLLTEISAWRCGGWFLPG